MHERWSQYEDKNYFNKFYHRYTFKDYEFPKSSVNECLRQITVNTTEIYASSLLYFISAEICVLSIKGKDCLC